MSMHSVTADRRELLRNGLLETIDHLTRRRASAIPPDFIDDYVAIDWLQWHGGSLKLTEVGENIRRQLVVGLAR
jgi:hypothetical protein